MAFFAKRNEVVGVSLVITILASPFKFFCRAALTTPFGQTFFSLNPSVKTPIRNLIPFPVPVLFARKVFAQGLCCLFSPSFRHGTFYLVWLAKFWKLFFPKKPSTAFRAKIPISFFRWRDRFWFFANKAIYLDRHA